MKKRITDQSKFKGSQIFLLMVSTISCCFNHTLFIAQRIFYLFQNICRHESSFENSKGEGKRPQAVYNCLLCFAFGFWRVACDSGCGGGGWSMWWWGKIGVKVQESKDDNDICLCE